MTRDKKIPEAVEMAIAVRAFASKVDVAPSSAAQMYPARKPPSPSEWVLIFDTETTSDAAQKLRFGTYQVRKKGELVEGGIFYSDKALTKKEIRLLQKYTAKHDIKLLTVQQFIEDVFYRVGYFYRATIVGFNLPFDISRLAIEHAPARSSAHNKIMRGGYTFKLSDKSYHPRVQIKHISSKDAFIQFAAPPKNRTSRSNRKKKRFQPVRRGFFIDAKTLAAALTSQPHSLASLAIALDVKAQKHDTEDHGRTLTSKYIDYAIQDTQTTWECYESLISQYALHGLSLTEPHKIHSEASLGKAYLKQMGVQPWRRLQPDFPNEILGQIMSAYYGGRSEIHIRKEPVQVLYCDFLSMYPTVCTLMGLWRFVTAKGMDWEDSTEATRRLLSETTIDHLQKQSTWQKLTTLVQVLPEEDIFPGRAKYGDSKQYTIGANYLTSTTPLWYTLADCLASKILTGRAPNVVRAITFKRKEMQDDLTPVCIAGNSDYDVDPREGDFFKRVIDLRREVKQKISAANPEEKVSLDSQQLALKILANATSYGIFVELNVEEEKRLQSLFCHGYSGQPIPLDMKKLEAPGMFFHPLLAALITGAARLMLATTERLALDAGLDWAFCDTDSMAIAKPENMEQETFYEKARQVQEWFTPLNPYFEKSPLLKIEDYNYKLSDGKTLEPLYCYAVSSKRYALYNLDDEDKPILRKVSEHGLGHLKPPYQDVGAQVLEGTLNWHHDLWFEIINAALKGQLADFSELTNFNGPAVSRYGATTPPLLRWFRKYNEGKPYSDQVKPFNFLLALQAKFGNKSLKPIAPYNKESSKAAAQCFDRETGELIGKEYLKNYHGALAQYHLHPETKFLNGNYTDQGMTERRHILVKSIQQIGKEANKWEEQFFIGLDTEAVIEYGTSPVEDAARLDAVLDSIKHFGIQPMANTAKLSRRCVSDICRGKSNATAATIIKLEVAAKKLSRSEEEAQELRQKIKRIMSENGISGRDLARQLGMDPSNIAKLISGYRRDLKKLECLYNYLLEQ